MEISAIENRDNIYEGLQDFLEPSCCKKRQKSPNMERLKELNDTKLVLNEPEWPP